MHSNMHTSTSPSDKYSHRVTCKTVITAQTIPGMSVED